MKQIQYPGKFGLNGLHIDLFTEDECIAIDRATRDVLWNYGVQVSDDECIKIFEDNGCIVNYETRMVRIPDFLLNRALASAPKTFYLYGRDDEHTVEQSWKGRVHYTCFGTGIQVCTYLGDGKYETRDSNSQDLAEIARLCDWADGISYFSLPVSARDYAGKGAEDVHEMYISIANTVKHFHHIDPVAAHVKYYWEMLKAFYGGDAEKARDRPLMSMLVCPTSPLELSYNAAQVIKQGAEYGIPVNVLSMAMSGGSSSVHLAGTLVTHNAEILSGIILAQIVKPGAPVFYGSSTTIFDLKHGTAPVGAPELGLISAGVAKLGQYYGLPVFTAGMQTDAKVPDSQAAHEKTITSLLAAMAGVNTIYGSGMLELGQTFSMEQLVIDNDIIAMERKAMEGIPVNDETLAVDVIKEIGVGRDFIGHPTTMANIELASDPTVFNRDMIGDWRAQGSKACVDVAHEIVVDVMKNHVVPPIDPEIAKKMEAIVEQADKDFLSKQ